MRTFRLSGILFLTIFLLFLATCKDREVTNPFDTGCPKELFTPSEFKAVQEGTAVKLTWAQSNLTINGFVINRSENDGAMAEVARIDKAITLWNDTKVVGGTKYGYQLYAYAGANLSNPQEVSITTSVLGPAVVTAFTASNITSTSAVLGGNVTGDGGAAVTERGICYGTSHNPTIANGKVAMGSGTGEFSSTVTGLDVNTTYYARAYATNIFATTYGSEINFTTIQPQLATVTTAEATSIGSASASLGGNVTSDGNTTVTERGICYGTSQNPTTGNTKVAIGSGTGAFSSIISGLVVGTTYYVRAYAINSLGTAYGNEVSFKPIVELSLASLSTSDPTSISLNNAILGGNVTNDGNSTVTERGVCYGTSQTPTTNSTKISIGNGTGIFSNTVAGLGTNTTYYVRAYAINSVGIAYGNQVSFKTLGFVSVPTLTTMTANNIAQTTATCGGNITADGGGLITARGVCFSINQNPTLSDNFTVDGSGTGQFASQLTNLLQGTIYYIRAYATNSAGTGYGAQVTFTTLKGLPVVTTKNITEITAMGGISGGIISSTGGGTISAKGICWGEVPNPTLSDNIINSGAGPSPFNSSIVSAVPGTTYYVRSYATNEVGTGYGDQKTFTALSNVNYYGFESGMLPVGWGGQWTVSSDKGFQSNYCLKSLTGVNSDATLSVTLTNAGQISFYYFLEGTWSPSIDFYIDNVNVGHFPKSSGWNQGFFNVNAGVHTFKWHFSADSGGTGYIDYIIFPK